MRQRRVVRLALAGLMGFELALAGLVYRLAGDLETRFRRAAEDDLVETAEFAATLLAKASHEAPEGHGPIVQPNPPARLRFGRVIQAEEGLKVTITDSLGRVLYDSGGQGQGRDASQRAEVRRALRGEFGTRLEAEISRQGTEPVLYVAAPIQSQGREVGVISIGKSVRGVQPFIDAAQRSLVLIGLGVGLAVLGMAAAFALWALRPLELILAYVQLRHRGRYPDRPQFRRSGLGLVGAALDEFLQALGGQRYVEEYVTTLTHELKSPLAAIVADAELLEDPMPIPQHARFVTDIQSQAQRVWVIIDRLLELATLERRCAPACRESLQLAPLLREAMERLRTDAQIRGVAFRLVAPAGCFVQGESFLLLQALDNLLRNALEFSPPGSWIEVTLTPRRREYDIAIRDHGPGIPDYALDRVFERFYSLTRPDTGRRSTGLGLRFVREIAELHHGDITLANHPAGGAVARLTLPKA